MNSRMNKITITLLTSFLLCINTVFAVDYNFQSTYSIPIKMSILEEISTKDGVLEGAEIGFKIIENVYYNGKLIVKLGDIVHARVSTVMSSGMNGFPASILVEDFKINGIKQSKLKDTYLKRGVNRCLWVYPIKWALTPLPGVGTFTNFIKGGHSKIKTTDVVTIDYYPEWE